MQSCDLTVVICTHNRRELLARTIASLNEAQRPRDARVTLLVIANACTDDTADWLDDYARESGSRDELPLAFEEEPVPGKSRALNHAIGLIRTGRVALVDDDQRVHAGFLRGVCAAFDRHPDVNLFCGRLVADWDGSEPSWVHEAGPYRIYPLPVPTFDLGSMSREVPEGVATPGGGIIFFRCKLFDRVGPFDETLGPKGHDLGGAEDIDWVRRARFMGERVVYVPDALQYHCVNAGRLRLPYVARKAYHRTSSRLRISRNPTLDGGVPLYMYRKAIAYLVAALTSLTGNRRRFYVVRLAATLGEIAGARSRRVEAT